MRLLTLFPDEMVMSGPTTSETFVEGAGREDELAAEVVGSAFDEPEGAAAMREVAAAAVMIDDDPCLDKEERGDKLVIVEAAEVSTDIIEGVVVSAAVDVLFDAEETTCKESS